MAVSCILTAVAIARCEQCGRPIGRTYEYVAARRPIGQSSAVICGVRDCENPALIWLTAAEQQEYENGERIFPLTSFNAVKLRVE